MKKSVLIIEDEDALRRALEVTFRNRDFNVSYASNGEEGLAKSLKEHPDMILLDIVMPKMDGLTMLKKLREDSWGHGAPVIVLTNLSTSEKVEETLEQGAFDFLVKTDWDLHDIVEKVNQRLKK
ncbi:MAG: hypothetical protein A2898_03445 [Candidatus Kerfeldbacteria bacterium RIFCSPLOWO2_01_FULL_48_11]|uniref:Response regulatory domain-containing protein n=1 Tax=Candidatus Kerfeldbacteria bacterium RIFCSPLOWO2_01_FULL_48_11 TaxID=1798543 RepID=A0A1G2B3M4_9BACT|nr:MAG: hypothetical protein UY34_C0009G0035 [Parcubacteria group bacterium GW2011_GWA2_48_9]KKW16246.1 MAG: hypothetical protein UY52_C0007G0006 [Parcubacteria group bacterium GW2011_GWC2_49_9]OGY83316.1 MAG: hypothetical protein A2898_03445 [Candidatus Kerfeldbacteria bacterium RIFCSPLOWO2_01_FULL_48_11]HCJ52139.1 two-component system response regulator [Candidatus Kerfeldbacteria bacterium]HCM68556.1 two-component system response regulator [Candidatus Kerfeldbacteria bacterium]